MNKKTGNFAHFRSETGQIFHGWYIVAASAWTNAIGGSVQWQGFTVFFLPIANSLGLSHAQAALPFALARAESGITGPIAGWLIDKYGVKPLMFIGTILTGIGYILLARTNSFLTFLLVYIFVISLGASTGFMQAASTSINMWFVKYRGMAMSLNSAAFRLGGAFMVPLLSIVVLKYGWQTAAFWVGIGMVVLIAPSALVFKRSPESIGTGPDGEKLRPKKIDLKKPISSNESTAEHDWTPRQAVKTSSFWTLALGTVLRMVVHGTIFIHFVPILVWKGESQQSAANMIGAMALISVPIILIFGWFSDKFSRQKLMSGLYLSAGISLLMINYVDGTWPIFLSMMLFIGTEVGSGLNWALVGDLFGRRHFATIRGWLAPIYNIALIFGPVGAGFIKDQTNSYEIVLVAGFFLMVGASTTFFFLRKPKVKPYSNN